MYVTAVIFQHIRDRSNVHVLNAISVISDSNFNFRLYEHNSWNSKLDQKFNGSLALMVNMTNSEVIGSIPGTSNLDYIPMV